MVMNDPMIWGPKAWFFLHAVAINYPENPSKSTQDAYYDFFRNLGNVLPCHTCQEHYKLNLGDGGSLRAALSDSDSDSINSINSIYSINSNALWRWTVDMHNKVNVSTGKPTISYKDAYDSLSNTTGEGSMLPKEHSLWGLIVLFVVVVVVAALYYWYSNRKGSCCRNQSNFSE